jgi:hypothetical protein
MCCFWMVFSKVIALNYVRFQRDLNKIYFSVPTFACQSVEVCLSHVKFDLRAAEKPGTNKLIRKKIMRTLFSVWVTGCATRRPLNSR